MTEEQIRAVDHAGSSDAYDDVERKVVAFAHELTRTSTVSDATWDALAEHFDPAQMVELTFVVAMWNMTNRLNNALRTPLEDEQEPARRLLFGEQQQEH